MELNQTVIHLVGPPDRLSGLLRLAETERLRGWSRLTDTGLRHGLAKPRNRWLAEWSRTLPGLSLLPPGLALLALLPLLPGLPRLHDGDEFPLVVMLPGVVDHDRFGLTVGSNAND